MAMTRIRVLLAEDHQDVADQLRGVLEAEFDVVAAVGDGLTLVATFDALRPDVIVSDVAMPRLDGMAAARAILRRDRGARIVFVTVLSDPALVGEALAVGALGYVLKCTAGEELPAAVRAGAAGRRYVSAGAYSNGP